jgi:hypothetical protein
MKIILTPNPLDNIIFRSVRRHIADRLWEKVDILFTHPFNAGIRTYTGKERGTASTYTRKGIDAVMV